MFFQDANPFIVVGQSNASGEPGHPSSYDNNVVTHIQAL
jgi:hypothetical protein